MIMLAIMSSEVFRVLRADDDDDGDADGENDDGEDADFCMICTVW